MVYARFCMAAVYGYWRSNSGSSWALKHYENMLIESSLGLHPHDIIELSIAFRWNRTHHRDHFRNLLKNHFKHAILKWWDDELEYN